MSAGHLAFPLMRKQAAACGGQAANCSVSTLDVWGQVSVTSRMCHSEGSCASGVLLIAQNDLPRPEQFSGVTTGVGAPVPQMWMWGACRRTPPRHAGS